MAGFFHLGTFLLFAAFALLLVSTISAPVIKQISFLDIKTGSVKATFGVFGYCANINSGSGGGCTGSHLGYEVTTASGAIGGYTFVNNHLETLTKALILHPIATGIAFIAFLIAAASDHIGFLFASMVAFLAFIVSLAAMVIDFVLFGIVKHEINNNTTANASFATAIWLTLAATVILFFASIIVCCGCFTGRRHKRNSEKGYDQTGYVGNGYNGAQMGGGAPAGAGGRRWYRRNRANAY
ncbi:hypothetical protein P7C73_g4180, partial [Tremellales sp. Uapishka_1]